MAGATLGRKPCVVPPRRVGLWTVHERVPAIGPSRFRVVCDCGAEATLRGHDLVHGTCSKGCRRCAPPGDGRPRDTVDGIGLTHEEIAQRLGISASRVQQIEKEALAKMRAATSPEWSGDASA